MNYAYQTLACTILIMKLFLIVVIALLLAWIIWSFSADNNLETPKYTVLEKRDGYEVRRYAPHIIAETVVSSESSNPTSAGFRELAGYIFGDNTANQSISMTAPVTTETVSTKIAMTAPVVTETSNDSMTMSFMMPSKYTLENLPNPNSKNVFFREVPSGTYAVLTFSGQATEAARLKKTSALENLLERDNLTTTSKPQLLQYDQPGKFPLLRTNEIKIMLTNYE